MNKKASVLVFGGGSDERLVSVASAQNLCVQFEFSELWYFHFNGSISRTSKDELKKHARPFETEFKPEAAAFAPSFADAVPRLRDKTVFMGFHGTEGEDGKIQATLEIAKISFTGSGSRASAECFDKARAKVIVAKHGGATADQILVNASDPAGSAEHLQKFFAKHGRIVVKPVASGSSFGLFIALDQAGLNKAIGGISALPYGQFLAESFIQGRELTVGVWDRGGRAIALPPSEVIMNSGRNFDYEGKYLGLGSTEVTPANLPAHETSKAQELALKAHQVLGCYGYSRTDMILTPAGPVFLETNTLPGMTRASFYPQQLAAAGYEMGPFIESQMELAEQRE